ncbi:unnamed protein product, partial [Rotaria sp. Silwood2]
IGKALIDTKTKYAIFYSSCHIDNFRNGSIIGDFILGFTRYQNVTRLNAFLNRTLIHQQLFGGTVLSIVFNSTIIEDTNSSDYSADYDVTDLINTSISNQDILSSSNDKLSQNMVVISSNSQDLEITEEGLSINRKHTTTNNNILSNNTNQNYKRILILIHENWKHFCFY